MAALPPRTGRILNSIVGHYIVNTVPVPSQRIAKDPELGVSPATIRNEMAYLEQEGFLIRPYTSAGCIPSDTGYRHYVESLENIALPSAEQRLISHVFHQAENDVEQWLSLAASLLAQLVHNIAVVSPPKTADCKLKHMELLSLQDTQVLLVVVLHGAKVKQRLITLEQTLPQSSLSAISIKLNTAYSGLTCQQMIKTVSELSDTEQQITGYLIEMLQAEDKQEYEEPYLDGLHFILNQPEFAQTERRQSLMELMELVEHRGLLKAIVPAKPDRKDIQVIIGKENREETIQEYSVVLGQYGLPGEATGTIGVVGPTRMPYSQAITAVYYLSSVLSELMASLYGREQTT